MDVFNKELKAFKSIFDKELEQFLEKKLQKYQSFSADISLDNGTALRRSSDFNKTNSIPNYQDKLNQLILKGGKRIRPFLFYFSYRIFGGEQLEEIRSLSVALELIQAFALIHDDVMDKSILRRNQATIHFSISQQYKDIIGSELASHFGLSQAILLGDLVFAYAWELISLNRSFFQAENYSGFSSLFSKMLEEVIWGQQLDITASNFHLLDRKLHKKIMYYKSACYTIVRPLQLGAILSGIDTKTLSILEKIGRKIGMAFQAKDDILSLIGKEKIIGKSIDIDIKEKKITFPLVEAYYYSQENKNIIEKIFKKKNLSRDDVVEIKTLLVNPKIVEKTSNFIKKNTQEAYPLVEQLPIDKKDKANFLSFLDYLTTRKY